MCIHAFVSPCHYSYHLLTPVSHEVADVAREKISRSMKEGKHESNLTPLNSAVM
jgi:hypothetical protein